PEPRAILVQEPAFVFDAAVRFRERELRPGFAACDVISGIETGKVPADDLARGVTRDAARTDVPARDPALRAQHVDRVVLYSVDQQTKSLLALAQVLLL